MYSPSQWFDLTLRGHAGSQIIINHFYYAQGIVELPGIYGILDPALDFVDIVLPKILAVVSTVTVFDQIDVEEHVSGSAVGSLALIADNVGLRGGDPMPKFVAWGFKSQRTDRYVPSAHKRFGALSEADVVDGVADGARLAGLNELALALGQAFAGTPSARTELYPVAVSLRDTSVDPSVPRLVPQFQPADVWSFQKVTSQVSRRP